MSCPRCAGTKRCGCGARRSGARLDEALADWNEAGRIWAANGGPNHPNVGIAAFNTADALWHHGRNAEAIVEADRALAIYEPLDDKRGLAFTLTARGGAREALGDHRGARTDLERAYALGDNPDTDPWLRAVTGFQLARALAGLGDRARARALATSARDVARDTGNEGLRGQADTFLRTLVK